MPLIGWQLLVVQEKSQIFEPLFTIMRGFYGILLIAIVLILLASGTFSGKIVKPILALRDAAQAISQGNLEPEIKVMEGGELGILGLTMQEMTQSLKTKETILIQLKDQLQTVADDLEQKVRVRTEEYLELAEEHKAMTKVLSHDIAGYLTTINLTCNTLSSSDVNLNEGKNSELDRLEELSRNACSLLSRFREFQAAQDGRLNIHLESVSIFDAFEDTLPLFMNKLSTKEIELDLSGIDRKHQVFVDREWFVLSILNNLLSNAIKYSYKQDRIRVVSTLAQSQVCIEIQDFGCGMAPQQIDQILKGGRSLSTPGTSGEKGTGFGLPLVARWVKYFNGKVEIHSHDVATHPSSHGTKVLLFFPISKRNQR